MAELVRPLHHDPFAPVLFSSPALELTEEQKQYMWEIIQLGASDSRFAQKTYNSIIVILTHGSQPLPQVNSISPTSAALGSESFDLHVSGANFDPEAKIVWNGAVEPTTFVSETELTTGVNMGTAEQAVQVPVQVQNENGALSNTQLFEFTPAAPTGLGVTERLGEQNKSVTVKK
jgi:hypothetical protein